MKGLGASNYLANPIEGVPAGDRLDTAAAVVAHQYWKQRKNPGANHYKAFTITNSAVAAGFGALAMHNYRQAEVAGSSARAGAVDYLNNPATAAAGP